MASCKTCYICVFKSIWGPVKRNELHESPSWQSQPVAQPQMPTARAAHPDPPEAGQPQPRYLGAVSVEVVQRLLSDLPFDRAVQALEKSTIMIKERR